jgi:geranylgeranyl pyrophosphate synthase
VSIDATTLLAQHARDVTRFLRDEIPILCRLNEAPPQLREAVEYSLLAGGKRLRPSLVLETHHALATGRGPGPSPLPAAAAVELIHTFSLVHDDLPAMDDDDLRRGRPTSHIAFGEALAILAGDAMTTMAFEVLAQGYAATPPLVAALVSELAQASGAAGMIGGQVLDIAAENQALSIEQLGVIHGRKTGALITCACRMGARVAGSDERSLEAMTYYGRHLGLAFQIADDLLDLTATSQEMGKETHKDTAAGKNTYPALLGLDGARAAARQEVERAIDALSSLGDTADGLRALARFAVDRSR